MVTFTLAGGTTAATRVHQGGRRDSVLPFAGRVDHHAEHPESTSHRGLSRPQRAALGITGGTIRLSVGIESTEAVVAAVGRAWQRLNDVSSQLGNGPMRSAASNGDRRPQNRKL